MMTRRRSFPELVLDLILLPFKVATKLILIMGRGAAALFGLILFGVGMLLCSSGILIIIGAPVSLLGAILVVKAL